MEHNQGYSIEIDFWRAAKVEPHDMAVHTEHVLAYQTSGSLKMDHGQVLEAGPGMLTVLPAGVPHRSLGGEDLDCAP